ncbi:MAG: DNA-3-methyladenine glycosylase I [Bryobacterales bacterium]|nr:DNA-3-methyladenine glycosylase I [Bryobacterales bacterium]
MTNPGIRCPWAKGALYEEYHDTEWGVPVHEDQRLFEFLILEGAQAGLSWQTILQKRQAYRRLFDAFDPRKVAAYDEKKISSLLSDASIVRNRAKVHSTATNARAFLEVQSEFGSFDRYLWRFVDGMPIQNSWREPVDVPAVTAEARALSKDLVSRGFKFVGPTICYAYMQATGMVNDHLVRCFRWRELGGRPKTHRKRLG